MSKRAELLDLVARLRAGEDPEAIAAELEQLARGPGRPGSSPDVGVWRRARRQIIAEAIFQGVLPEATLPEPDDDDLREKHKREQARELRHAAGNRKHADQLAAQLLATNTRDIRRARRSVTEWPEGEDQGPMTGKQWDELVALMRIIQSGKPPTD